MLRDEIKERIRRLAADYPRPSSGLLPALDLLRRCNNGRLSRSQVAEAAGLLGLSPGDAWSAAASYSLFQSAPPGRYHIQIDDGVPAYLAGAGAVADRLSSLLGIGVGESTGDGLFSLSLAADIGAADIAPALRINDRCYGPLNSRTVEGLVAGLRRDIRPPTRRPARRWSSCSLLLDEATRGHSLRDYRSRGGYVTLDKIRQMGREEIVAVVEDAGLRGRGGAGYSTAAKWRSVRRDGGPVYLICNADEGEPGTFKDRVLIEESPHFVLEGIVIAARAIGADRAFVYLRGEYRRAAALLTEAVAGAAAEGLLRGLRITVHCGAGSYICGEETALIASLEGRRGVPRSKPPFPTDAGLYGRPTVVNNVETLAALPVIFRQGPGLFRRLSPRLFSVSGHVAAPGLYEFPEGTALVEVLAAAGGLSEDLKAVILGGLSQPVLTAAEARDLSLDEDSCRRAGTSLGTGAVIAMNSSVRLREIAYRTASFFADESCGQCAPCREGTSRLRELFRRCRDGGGKREDLAEITRLGRSLDGLSLCPAGNGGLRAVAGMPARFAMEFLGR